MRAQDIGNNAHSEPQSYDFSFGNWKVSFQCFEHCQSVGNVSFTESSLEPE
jgi:hypothetical protein